MTPYLGGVDHDCNDVDHAGSSRPIYNFSRPYRSIFIYLSVCYGFQKGGRPMNHVEAILLFFVSQPYVLEVIFCITITLSVLTGTITGVRRLSRWT